MSVQLPIHVLHVDGDDVGRSAVGETLRRAGFRVREAASGAQALSPSDESPEVILLAARLPDMEAGEFRQRQLQEPTLAPVPVLLLSPSGEGAVWVAGVRHLQVPANDEALLAAVRAAVTERRPGVLVVDDDSGVRGLLSYALEKAGFAVRLASGGQEALEVYRQNPGAVDVVLLDVQMVGGWDGVQTLAALRQLDPQVRAVFMSGHTGQYEPQQLVDLGAACVVDKPFQLAKLADTLRELANLPAPGGP
jgi:CheY-like chemotaxis protein